MKKVLITVAVIIAAAVVYFIVMEKQFYGSFVKRAMEIRKISGVNEGAVITEKDLNGLPAPVKRYMRYSGVIGKKPASFVHLIHGGTFRPDEKMGWLPIWGEYFITSKKPSFAWYGKASMAPVWITAVDSCFEGKGRMNIRFMSAFTLADAQGPAIDKSSFGRLITEMTMCPSVLLDKNTAKWEPINASSAKLIFSDSGLSAAATVRFNPDGSMDRILVRRYFGTGADSRLETFEGKGLEPKEFGGYKIPSYFIGTWKLKTGDLEYVRFRVEKVEYW